MEWSRVVSAHYTAVDIDSQGQLPARSACTSGFWADGFCSPLSGPYRTLALEWQVDPELLGFQFLLFSTISLVVPNRHAWAQWLLHVSSLIASVFAKEAEPK